MSMAMRISLPLFFTGLYFRFFFFLGGSVSRGRTLLLSLNVRLLALIPNWAVCLVRVDMRGINIR